MSADRISIDLDLDDDLGVNDFDMALARQLAIEGSTSNGLTDEAMPTLESILNEDDDLENDEILKSLTQSLTIMDSGASRIVDRTHVTESMSSESKSLSRSSSMISTGGGGAGFNNNNVIVGHAQYSNLIEKNGVVCRQSTLKQISSQLTGAIERSDAGLPTVLAVSQLVAVGTSRGLVLLFDAATQVLKLYITTEHKEAISALSLNNKCDRLLVGNALGYIFMFDTQTGKCLRKLTEAHPHGNAVLNLKFTDDPTLACFSDSGGSVFMLEFTRTMGVRGADSTCIFSGSRGEVCDIAALRFEKFAESILGKLTGSSARNATIKRNLDNINFLFNKYSLLAMCQVLADRKLAVCDYAASLEQDSTVTQLKKYVTPILACARESTIYFFQVDYFKATDATATESNSLNASSNNANSKGPNDLEYKFKFVLLKKSQFKFKIYNFCWLNAKTIAILDNTEKLHIVDIRTDEELQVLANLTEQVQLVYNSSFFKSLSTGGYVSKALAYAGENACYQTFQGHAGHLYLLGKKSITQFELQTWLQRIDDFLVTPITPHGLELAIDLALAMFTGETKALIGLPMDTRLRKQRIVDKLVDILFLYIDRGMKQDCPSGGKLDVLERHYKKISSKCVHVCTTIDRQDILFDSLYGRLSVDSLVEGFFFESLEEHVLADRLTQLPPQVIKNFVDYYEKNPRLHPSLEKCLFHFEIASLDLHAAMQVCRKYAFTDAFIYLNNKAFVDYLTPFEELIKMMNPIALLNLDKARMQPSSSNVKAIDTNEYERVVTIGNKLLVYLHCCLCGQSYPYETIADDQLSDRVRRETFALLTAKRSSMIDKLVGEQQQTIEYPFIRVLLNFNALDFLNVIAMAFDEPSFEAVVGLDGKQQLVDILIDIGFGKTTNVYSRSSAQLAGHLFTFLARQISNTNNNIEVDNSVFSEMIEFLCDRDESDRLEEREQSLISLLNSFSMQIMDHFDVERMLHLAQRAKFYRVCEILYEFRGEYYEIVDCYLNYEETTTAVVVDDRQKQIFDVVRSLLNILYEQDGGGASMHSSRSMSSGIGGMVATNASLVQKKRLSISSLNQKLRSFTTHTRSGSLLNVEPRDVQLKKLQEKLIRPRTLKKLISISPMETIHLLWIEMNIDLKYLIKSIKNYRNNSRNERLSLSSSPSKRAGNSTLKTTDEVDEAGDEEVAGSGKTEETEFERDDESGRMLYTFMRGLFELVELIKIDRKYINYISQFNSSEHCELYIDLVCRFEPNKLLYELRSTLDEHSYRVDECLRICRARKHWDGAAYLLEKSGQVEAAFALYLEKVAGLIKDLQRSLETLSERELNILKSNIDALLVMIVQLCQRNNCALSESAKEKIWFSLFEEIMKPIRSLFIHPSIEALLKYNGEDLGLNEDLQTKDDSVKERLNETKEFFKNLGSYIINSMVGYLSLTTIIDRIMGDPLYGAANFGDIRELMVKMLDMCAYERTLLTKTASLVSRDVYTNMLVYKRISCRSYSLFSQFCSYCSRPLDPVTKAADTLSITSGVSNASNMSPLSSHAGGNMIIGSPTSNAENSLLDSKMSITIYQCGHSFHLSCLEILQTSQASPCPICNPVPASSQLTVPDKAAKLKQRIKKNNSRTINQQVYDNESSIDYRYQDMSNGDYPTTSGMVSHHSSSSLGAETKLTSPGKDSLNLNDEDMSLSSVGGAIREMKIKSTLSSQQVLALKSIRKRNMTLFKVTGSGNGYAQTSNEKFSGPSSRSFNTDLERQGKLNLAPANLVKFI